MIEVVGNLWEYKADVRVITTNGTVKKNGECVMGRGCALEAKKVQPNLPRALGRSIEQHSNHVFLLNNGDVKLYSFPVKHNWYERADVDLIMRSAEELSACVNDGFEEKEDLVVVMPRPGCGNGGLKWENVKPILEPILDDRFHVITFKRDVKELPRWLQNEGTSSDSRTIIMIKRHIQVSSCVTCPFYTVEGMEHMMNCDHPYWRGKEPYAGAIITQDSRHHIPSKCPLRHTTVTTSVSLAK